MTLMNYKLKRHLVTENENKRTKVFLLSQQYREDLRYIIYPNTTKIIIFLS